MGALSLHVIYGWLLVSEVIALTGKDVVAERVAPFAVTGAREKFGAFIRREREGKEIGLREMAKMIIGLREMAKMIGVSPTYLSKVERDEFPHRPRTR